MIPDEDVLCRGQWWLAGRPDSNGGSPSCSEALAIDVAATHNLSVAGDP
ncbi:MAG: hypothetical protein JWN61_3235 [Pseudonocardiales bacterium]|nr:hypothetical protein [Pseudonocardiales bacterium]